jgi:predicted RNA-binding Zn ribbon-like protein
MGLPNDSLRSSRLSIDLTWTLRFRNVSPTDTLHTPSDLRAWATSHELPTSGRLNGQDLERFREFREVLFGAFTRSADGQALPAAQRRLLNAAAVLPPYRPVLTASNTIILEHDGSGVDAALNAIARDALELLTLHNGRLRRCEGPQCALIFHDESRPGTRRWCATARCGNRVNTHSYRQRRTIRTDGA